MAVFIKANIMKFLFEITKKKFPEIVCLFYPDDNKKPYISRFSIAYDTSPRSVISGLELCVNNILGQYLKDQKSKKIKSKVKNIRQYKIDN